MALAWWLLLLGCASSDDAPRTIETDRPPRFVPVDTAAVFTPSVPDATSDTSAPPCPEPTEPPVVFGGGAVPTGDQRVVRATLGARFGVRRGRVGGYRAGALGRWASVLVSLRDGEGHACEVSYGLDHEVPWIVADAAAVSTVADDDGAVARWLAERGLEGGFALRAGEAVPLQTNCAFDPSVAWGADPFGAWMGGATPGAWYVGVSHQLLSSDLAFLQGAGVSWPPIDGWASGIVRVPVGVPSAPRGGEYAMVVASYTLDRCDATTPAGETYAWRPPADTVGPDGDGHGAFALSSVDWLTF
ncbi:MAG: hypothetical protein H6733_08685 [Alphaproteobacteria bacterium]|nr:hypothetical protein [Alphaproteobacteria bacterium]